MGNFSSFQRQKHKPSTTSQSSFAPNIRLFGPVSPPSPVATPPNEQASLEHARRFRNALDRMSIFPPEQNAAPPAHNRQYVPPKKNNPGLPDTLKNGVESLSGLSLDDVHVHYHSSKPEQIEALAYTQGKDIHIASGQERYLAHEAWHVVQQKQGRVKPRLQTKGIAIDNNEGLEREADIMGARAATGQSIMELPDQPTGMYTPMQARGSIHPLMPSSPVQRVAKAKISIAQPTGGTASIEVPDLPQTLVDQINNATTKADRQSALDQLLAYLDSEGAVDDPTRTKIKYVHQNNANYAVTKVEGTQDNDPVKITVYRNAFAAGIAALYSAVRHELIHVSQRLLVPDDKKAEGTDEYMYENIYDQAVGVNTRDTLQKPLQEIEAHVFELLHASETGISNNATYLKATIRDLTAYAQLLIQTVKDKVALPQASFDYWREYLINAVTLLTNAYNNITPKNKAIESAYTQLQSAIAQRTPTRARSRSTSAPKPPPKGKRKSTTASSRSRKRSRTTSTVGGVP